MLAPQHAERGWVEREITARHGGEPEPARGEDAQDVPVREERHVSGDALAAGGPPVAARPPLVGGLAREGGAARDRPAGLLPADLPGGAALVPAIVPLQQIRL